MAHELNTPIGNSLMAASIISEINQSLIDKIGMLHFSVPDLFSELRSELRNELQTEMHICQQSAEMLERNLKIAAALVTSYKDMNTRNNELNCGTQDLIKIIENAWELALTPGHSLDLVIHCDAMIAAPLDVLSAIMIQLFENIQRHAYDEGYPGQVQVTVQTLTDATKQSWVNLKVTDHGRGITADLLPRIFEPYVSTQFGRGRSGLGLFVVQVAVKQRLSGRIHALSQSGSGTSIEIVWPQNFSRKPVQSITLESAVADYLSSIADDKSDL